MKIKITKKDVKKFSGVLFKDLNIGELFTYTYNTDGDLYMKIEEYSFNRNGNINAINLTQAYACKVMDRSKRACIPVKGELVWEENV